MFFRLCILSPGLAVAALSWCSAETSLPPRSSEEFPGKMEALAEPEEEQPAWVLFSEGVGNSSGVTNGVLIFSSAAADDASGHHFWRLPQSVWTANAAEQGYSIEIRAKAGAEKSFGLNVSRSEPAGAGYALLRIGPSGTEWLSGEGDGLWTTLDESDNSSDFQIFRLVKKPQTENGPGLFALYRNGKLIGDDLIGQQNTAEVKEDRFLFGDVGTWDSAAEIDYVRWDPAGAFSPPAHP